MKFYFSLKFQLKNNYTLINDSKVHFRNHLIKRIKEQIPTKKYHKNIEKKKVKQINNNNNNKDLFMNISYYFYIFL